MTVGHRVLGAVLTASLLVVTTTLSGCATRDEPRPVLPSGTESRTIDVDGTSREYLVHVPDRRAAEATLVVFLHGGFGSAAQAEFAYDWDEIADRERIVVAYPQGDGAAWNAGDCCGTPARRSVDDVAFISAVVAELQAELGVAPSRTFATGMSNGAMMTYRMACDTDMFAAIAPVAGTVVTPCDSPPPASVLHIHGLDDERVRYDGEPGSGATRVDGLPVDDVIALWRAADACQDPVVTHLPPLTTTRSSCADGRVVELITISGAGHQWPGAAGRGLSDPDPASSAINATETIWDFFDDD
ncbi:alpha/beta hydrolase family esterase [Promicromonospora soli]